MNATPCPNCAEYNDHAAVRCCVCGAILRRSTTVGAHSRRRRGEQHLPVIALLGVLPLFPVSSVIGIAAGAAVLVNDCRAEQRGWPLYFATAGVVGGTMWMVVGTVLLFTWGAP
jgi:hypothetical protein